MSKHTAGDLVLKEFEAGEELVLVDSTGECVAQGGGEWPEPERSNMRRLAAAWNAVAGIPTEALEGGVIRELVEALKLASEELYDARIYSLYKLTDAILAKVTNVSR